MIISRHFQTLSAMSMALAFVGLQSVAFGQKFFTRSGSVSFFSSTPIEDIEAESVALTAIFDASTGEVAFQVAMRSFHFPNALMEEHFNENYVESEIHPKATFSGSVVGWPVDGEAVVARGELTCHGVTVAREIGGTLRQDDEGHWVLEAAFDVPTADHEIPIPAVVRENIAESVAVQVKAQLQPK
jgi:hypothetical protein